MLEIILDGRNIFFDEEEEGYCITKGYVTSKGFTIATIVICEDLEIIEE